MRERAKQAAIVEFLNPPRSRTAQERPSSIKPSHHRGKGPLGQPAQLCGRIRANKKSRKPRDKKPLEGSDQLNHASRLNGKNHTRTESWGYTQWEELTSGCLKNVWRGPLPSTMGDSTGCYRPCQTFSMTFFGSGQKSSFSGKKRRCGSLPVEPNVQPRGVVGRPTRADSIDTGFCHRPHRIG